MSSIICDLESYLKLFKKSDSIIHPEKYMEDLVLWRSIIGTDYIEKTLKNPSSNGYHLARYVKSVLDNPKSEDSFKFLNHLKNFITNKEYSEDKSTYVDNFMTVSIIFQYIFMLLFQKMEDTRYSSILSNEKFKGLLFLEEMFWKDLMNELYGESFPFDYGKFVTDVVVRHAAFSWHKSGRKAYTVSPSLRWRLENTRLKGLSANDLKLPYNAIYVSLPPIYEISGGDTGKHKSDGCYIIGDKINDNITKWRIILVGKENENSKYEQDDAIYHWSLSFHKNKTVDECVNESLEVVKNNIYKDPTSSGVKEKEINNFMKNNIIKLTNYVINVVLYATMSDVDVMIVQADPEYQRLFDRAMKLDKKSKKRKNLLKKANDIGHRPRIMLGGNIYIDRSKEQTESGNKGIRKIKVRTLVSGHWRNQAKGKGRMERERIWIEPFWRGPEFAPVTEKTHVMR